MAVTPLRPLTCTGVGLLVVVPFPSSPYPFEPQGQGVDGTLATLAVAAADPPARLARTHHTDAVTPTRPIQGPGDISLLRLISCRQTEWVVDRAEAPPGTDERPSSPNGDTP